MALAAAQVLDALQALLAPMSATAGRVYTSRGWPLATLPAWRVTAEDEDVQPASVGEPLNVHELAVNATAYASAAADLDDTLHALAASGLTLLFDDPPYSLELRGLSRRLVTEGEASVGAITLRLICRYWVNPATPETIYS